MYDILSAIIYKNYLQQLLLADRTDHRLLVALLMERFHMNGNTFHGLTNSSRHYDTSERVLNNEKL